MFSLFVRYCIIDIIIDPTSSKIYNIFRMGFYRFFPTSEMLRGEIKLKCFIMSLTHDSSLLNQCT